MSNYWVKVEELETAIGKAVAAWGNVELLLQLIFLKSVNDQTLAMTVWESVVSFDAKLRVIQRILKQRLLPPDTTNDATALLNHTRKLYGTRNKFAHSTITPIDDDTPAISPFFNGHSSETFSAKDALTAKESFDELRYSLDWLDGCLRPEASTGKVPPRSSEKPVPDLVLRLRAEDERSREEQSRRQKLLAHATRLAKEGRLPEWE